MIGYIKSITLLHGVIAAVVAIVLAMVVFRGGLLNVLLWIVGIGALVIGVVNQLSYGGSSRG